MTWHESRETIYFNRNHRQKISFSFLLPSLTIQARGLNNLVSRTTMCRGGGKMRRKGWKLRDKTRSGGVFFTRGGSTLSSKIMRCVSSGPWKSEPKGKERKKKKKHETNSSYESSGSPWIHFLFFLPFPRDLSQWCFVTGSNFFYFSLLFFRIKICIYFIFGFAPNNVFNQPEKTFDRSMGYDRTWKEVEILDEEGNISVVPIFTVQGG